MVILKNGRAIINAFQMKEYLEECGFDTYPSEIKEIVKIIANVGAVGSDDVYPYELEIEDLENTNCKLLRKIDNYKDEIEALNDRILDLEDLIDRIQPDLIES